MRLIDADKLDWWYKGRPIRRVIDEAPTVDAVPVVRCKDCKHWNKDALHCNALPFETTPEHENWYEYDFCSYGERKDNERQN